MPRVFDDTDKGPRWLGAAQEPCHVQFIQSSGERGAARGYVGVGSDGGGHCAPPTSL